MIMYRSTDPEKDYDMWLRQQEKEEKAERDEEEGGLNTDMDFLIKEQKEREMIEEEWKNEKNDGKNTKRNNS